MNEKRNRKRWHCVHWNSMIMQRLSSKPMGRRREIRGANSMTEQELSTSIKGSIRTANGHHDTTPIPLHPMATSTVNGRHSSSAPLQSIPRIPRQPTGTRLWLRINTVPHPRPSKLSNHLQSRNDAFPLFIQLVVYLLWNEYDATQDNRCKRTQRRWSWMRYGVGSQPQSSARWLAVDSWN